MSYVLQLAQVKSILNAVSNIGTVHDNVRWIKDSELFLAEFTKLIGTQKEIRAWIISRTGGTDEIGASVNADGTRVSIPTGTRLRRYDWAIEGFMGFKDNSTEVDFQALVDAVIDAFKDKLTLNNTAMTRGSITYRIDHTFFSDNLCHHILIQFYSVERDGISPV